MAFLSNVYEDIEGAWRRGLPADWSPPRFLPRRGHGQPGVHRSLGHAAFRGPKAFRRALAKYLKRDVSVFRAGQCPGGQIRNLVAELAAFSKTLGPVLARTLQACTRGASVSARENALRSSVQLIAESDETVRGTRVSKTTGKRTKATFAVLGGKYRRKRLCELLFLGMSDGAGGLHMRRREADAAAGVWPVATGTADGIRKIWSRLPSLREALRVLQRALKPGDIDIPSISALLCFKEKDRKGRNAWSE